MATMQDFSGLLFGGGGTGLEGYITPEQQQAIQQQSMLQAAAALLQAGGPSRQPISIGQALGGALQAGQQGYQQAQTGAIQNLLVRQKLMEAKRLEDFRKALQNQQLQPAQPMGEVTTITPDQAISVGGLPAGPTVARANLIGQQVQAAPKPMSEQDMLYQDAMNKYKIAERYGMSEEASKYLEKAQKIKPMEKVSGAPFEVTDATTGKPIMVQQFDTGRLQTLSGYGPKRDVVLQSLGGKTVAIDKSKLAGGETYAQTLAPQVVGGAEGGYYVVGGGGGGVGGAPSAGGGTPRTGGAPAGQVVPPAAPAGAPPMAGAPIPIIAGTGAKPPEAFMKASRQLNDLRGAIEDYKIELKSGVWVAPKNIPIPFTDSGMPLPSGEDTARVAGKYNSLLMGVKNLYELGALTGPDMAIIERQLTNPSSWTGLLTSKNAMNAQVKVVEDMLDRADKNLSSSYKQPMPAAATTATQKIFTYNPATGQLEQK